MSLSKKVWGFMNKYGAPAVIRWLGENVLGFKQQQPQQPGSQSVEGPGGVRTTTLPDGTQLTQMPKLPPEAEKEFRKLLPEMIKAVYAMPEKFPEFSQIVKQAQEAFGGPAEVDVSRFEFEPIAAEARKQFHEKTLPSIAERFTSLTGGGQRAGAFERQKAQAGVDLESKLAALKGQLQPQYDIQRGQLGLQARGQGLREAQLGLQHQAAKYLPKQFRIAQMRQLLSGGVSSPYDTFAQQQSPGFAQQMLPQAIGAGIKLLPLFL